MIGRAALAAGLLAAAAPAPEPMFAIARLVSDLPGAMVIGHARSGLICTPAGSLHWRDAAPDLMEASHRAAAAMHEAGLDVAVPDPDVALGDDDRTAVEIVPTLAAIHMDACTPWRGIKLSSTQHAVKATGRAMLIWRAYGRRSRLLRRKVTTCVDFGSDRDVTALGRAAENMIAKAGVIAVPVLKSVEADPANPLPAEQIGCTAAELAASDKG